MSNKTNSTLFKLLFTATAIAGVFLAVANGTSWAKISIAAKNSSEKAFKCDTKYYVLTNYGLCDKLTINEANAKDRCIEWQDESIWRAFDNNNDSTFWNDADRTWEAIKILVPVATALCLLAVLLTLLSCTCTSLQGSPRLSTAALLLNAIAFGLALGCWSAALDTSQLTEEDYESLTTCSDIEMVMGPGLILTILASILLFLSVAASVVWKCKAGLGK